MLHCDDDRRREAVRAHPGWNGLDFVEVNDAQTTLTVYFLGKAPAGITVRNVAIDGGRRPQDAVRILSVDVQPDPDPRQDDRMLVHVDKPGDYSTYTLRLVDLEHIDPRYDRVEFSFKANCPTDLDCAAAPPCPPPIYPQPEIDYLAKDYASFRQLILDRLSLIMPDWQERHIPDLGITLVELLAYTGDYLSYYQDAVATEAYLETARRRPSVRRHARLVDYVLSEGCNARALVCLDTDRNLRLDAQDVWFVTGLNEVLLIGQRAALTAPELEGLPPEAYEVFEPMRRDASIPVWKANNILRLYTWGNRQCCLGKGSTRATLRGELAQISLAAAAVASEAAANAASAEASSTRTLAYEGGEPLPDDQETLKIRLQPGDIIIFEEVIGPQTGKPADADPRQRHAVRLTRVTPWRDALLNEPVFEIEWGEEDALPFELCLSAIGPAPECAFLEDISIARGNVVLVDHGRTRPPESLGEVPLGRATVTCECEGHPSDIVTEPGRYRPHLQRAPLTFRQPLPADAPAPEGIRSASTLLTQDPRWALPAIYLESIPPRADGSGPLFGWDDLDDATGLAQLLAETQDDSLWSQLRLSRRTRRLLREYRRDAKPGEGGEGTPPSPPPEALVASLADDLWALVRRWEPRGDLLASGPDDRHFVVEMEEDGTANLRFGDDETGEEPEAGMAFRARYRIGNGRRGNVGAGAICLLVHRNSDLRNDILRVRNPLPAQGGTSPEPMSEARLNAPFGFRIGPQALRRAITADDYARLAERHPKLQRAAARLTWTGSWFEAGVALDLRAAASPAIERVLTEVETNLERYRRIGHDLDTRRAQYVSIELGLHACIAPEYLRGHVKTALLDVFSNRMLTGGRLGFFHPDNLTFGDDIYASRLIAAAQVVPGVVSVEVTRLQRQFEPPNRELENGVLPLGPFEIAQLDNDPNYPDHGRLQIEVIGGR